jgi:hypothetical protein
MEAWHYISALEKDPQWQATAENADGNPIVIMRGCPGDRFYEKDYYTWLGGEIGYPYTLSGIRELFSSGKLKLLRGDIPVADSQELLNAGLK